MPKHRVLRVSMLGSTMMISGRYLVFGYWDSVGWLRIEAADKGPTRKILKLTLKLQVIITDPESVSFSKAQVYVCIHPHTSPQVHTYICVYRYTCYMYV